MLEQIVCNCVFLTLVYVGMHFSSLPASFKPLVQYRWHNASVRAFYHGAGLSTHMCSTKFAVLRHFVDVYDVLRVSLLCLGVLDPSFSLFC